MPCGNVVIAGEGGDDPSESEMFAALLGTKHGDTLREQVKLLYSATFGREAANSGKP